MIFMITVHSEEKIWKRFSRSCLLGAMALGVFGITYVLGNKDKHNHVYHGKVVEEKELYGNAIIGYATERGGIKGFVEKSIHGALRPGSAMKLYGLDIEKVEYDTVEWFNRKHHVDEDLERRHLPKELEGLVSLHIQTEGDIADVGDKFSASRQELGRLSKTFLVRGVRYSFTDKDGKENTINLPLILKNAGDIKFYK